uniref:Uncharacterized protein n=1 Tax=Glossina austeni TaxID=7395 RepID=A0A1A9UJH6_GLOAU
MHLVSYARNYYSTIVARLNLSLRTNDGKALSNEAIANSKIKLCFLILGHIFYLLKTLLANQNPDYTDLLTGSRKYYCQVLEHFIILVNICIFRWYEQKDISSVMTVGIKNVKNFFPITVIFESLSRLLGFIFKLMLFQRIASSFGCDRKILTQEEKISAQFYRHYVH